MGLYDFEFLADMTFTIKEGDLILLSPFKTLQGLPPRMDIEEPEPKADNADN